MREMIADYMETGFLDNITEMFRQDSTLLGLIPFLMSDPRGRVRLGTVALVETLLNEYPREIARQVPELAILLRADHPTVKADAVYLMGIIGDSTAIPHLEALQEDANPQVRALVLETIEELAANERKPFRQ